MALEMAASRMLLPFYGDSHLVWANLIGLVLAALAVGYYVGGTMADRRPSRRVLSCLIAGAGLWIGLIPFAGKPLLRLIENGSPPNQTGLILGSLLAVLALFAVPAVLLGCVPPFVIRLALGDVRGAGKVAGRVYAISTVGSMIGTFVPVLWLMPTFGVRATFMVVAAVLLLAAAPGMVFPSIAGVETAKPSRVIRDTEEEAGQWQRG